MMWAFQLLKGFGAGSSVAPNPPTSEDLFVHSPADIVRHLLVAHSMGTMPTANGNWPIGVNSEQATPDDCITVYDTAGMNEGSFQATGQLQTQHGIQVRVRSRTHAGGGWAKADTIAKVFDQSVLNEVVTIGSSQYLVYDIARTGPVISIGKDSTSQRNLYTVNAVVAVRPLEA